MRILGIDFGDSRVGIAVSDPFGWTAQAVETIKNKEGSINGPIQRIMELIEKYEVKRIVVGYPKNMNGTIGERAEKTEEFIKKMNNVLQKNKISGIDIIKWDERLSTVAANRTMTEAGVKASRKKGLVDQIATVYILQGYLDSIRI